jgi:hypothetical protein
VISSAALTANFSIANEDQSLLIWTNMSEILSLSLQNYLENLKLEAQMLSDFQVSF